eukprot:15484402-Alexandrium_andersonii.AAC.1
MRLVTQDRSSKAMFQNIASCGMNALKAYSDQSELLQNLVKMSKELDPAIKTLMTETQQITRMHASRL